MRFFNESTKVFKVTRRKSAGQTNNVKLYLEKQKFIEYSKTEHGHVYQLHRATFMSYWVTFFRFA